MSDIFTLIAEGKLEKSDITFANVNSIFTPIEGRVDSEKFFGTNPFLFAVMNNKKEYLKMLKDKGANINFIQVSPIDKDFIYTKPTSPIGTPGFYNEAQTEAIENKCGDNAMILAIKNKDNFEMLEYLHTELGFPLDYVNYEGETLAHIAIDNNAANCMVYVLNNYPQAYDIKDNEGLTPVERAKYYDVNSCNWAFYRVSSARSTSSQSSREGQADSKNAVQIIDLPLPELLERKTDLKLIYDKKKKPLAKPQWDDSIKKQLLKKLDDFANYKDEFGRNILHLAILNRATDAFTEIMKTHSYLLLEPDNAVENFDEPTKPGETPLEMLFKYSQVKNRDEDFVQTAIHDLWVHYQNQFNDDIKNQFTELFEKDKSFEQLLCPGGTALFSF